MAVTLEELGSCFDNMRKYAKTPQQKEIVEQLYREEKFNYLIGRKMMIVTIDELKNMQGWK